MLARYLTTPYGEVNGLRLRDGVLIMCRAHRGAGFAAAAQPGQRVRVIGRRGPGGELLAEALLNLDTGGTAGTARTAGAAGAATMPPAPPALRRFGVAGMVELILRGPRGEANGVILRSGDVVYFRPALARMPLAPDAPFAAIGIGLRGANGVTIEAAVLGPDLAALRQADPNVETDEEAPDVQ